MISPEMLALLASIDSAPPAYLDPGSGSYLLQLLIAGALGGLLMLRIYWGKVTDFFRKLFGRSLEDDEE